MTAHAGPAQYTEFWSRYLRRVAVEHPDWRDVGTPSARNYLDQGCAVPNCRLAPAFKRDGQLGHELVIMSPNAEWNRNAFDWLAGRRLDVETAYGRPLRWDPRPGQKRYLIGEYTDGSADHVEATDSYIDWFLDCGARMRTVLDRFGPDLVRATKP